MLLHSILATLALLSLLLTFWQWLVARRFPLHRRTPRTPFAPGVTLLKPLKGAEAATERCLRSWLVQEYRGPVQVLFAVADPDDPAVRVVRRLLEQFPAADADLVVCRDLRGTNLKVAKLAQLEPRAKHDLLIISDADVLVPSDFLAQVVQPLADREVGLVNCFYRLANPRTPAMQWEAIAINADFWSQVLQAASLKPLNFALGAVMATRHQLLQDIGGFEALADCLADDYQLGNRIAARGHRIALCPVVVECWSEPSGWSITWKHQLRWARTIRVCQPVPYFFSILNNATFWPLLWLVLQPAWHVLDFVLACVVVRVVSALTLEAVLTKQPASWSRAWRVPLKDLLQTAIWVLAFTGSTVEWRGRKMQLRRDGTLVPR